MRASREPIFTLHTLLNPDNWIKNKLICTICTVLGKRRNINIKTVWQKYVIVDSALSYQ